MNKTMIRRVAEAIANARDGSAADTYDQFADMIKEDLDRQARAAIEAMVEPTTNMEDAGFDAGHEGDGEWMYADPMRTYKAMMQKALEE